MTNKKIIEVGEGEGVLVDNRKYTLKEIEKAIHSTYGVSETEQLPVKEWNVTSVLQRFLIELRK